MTYPRVTRSHEIDRQAMGVVRSSLPAAWTAEAPEQGSDYGVDLWVQLAHEGQMTPQRVALQVKGSAGGRDLSRIRMKRDTLRLLLGLADLALLVKVDVRTGRIWLVPVDDHRVGKALSALKRRDVSIRLTPHDLVTGSEDFVRRVEVLAFRIWQAHFREPPETVWIRLVGWSVPGARHAIDSIRGLLPRRLRLDDFPAGPSHAVQAELHAGPPPYVRDVARPTRELQLPTPNVDGGIGLALTVATGLLDVGLGYLAAQLAQTALPLAEVAEPMDAVPLTHAIYRHLGPHAFVSVLLEAARGGRAWPASVLAQSAVAGARFSVDESELSTIFGAARTRATEPAMRAQLRMNEARALLRCGQRQGALAAMESVVGDDPRYRGYPHWWLEIGGLNATLGNVLRALACYQAAQELGADRTEVAARRSHMYMKRGEWSKAAETWSATPPASQSRWNGMGYLSAFVAWMWRTVLGAPDVTDRSRQEAAEWCRAHNSELDALTDDIGRAVFLDPTNLELLGATADLCRKRGDASLSFVCDLTAAMIMESNPEPWATAWLLLAETKLDGATQEAVSIAILDFVGPLIGGDLIRVVRRLVGPKLQPNLAELEAQLDALRESAVPRTANIVTKDGVVSIDLTDTSEP